VTVCVARLTVTTTEIEKDEYTVVAVAVATIVHEPAPENVNALDDDVTAQPEVLLVPSTEYVIAPPPEAGEILDTAGNVKGESVVFWDCVGAQTND